MVVFIMTAAAIYSLGHGLRTSTVELNAYVNSALHPFGVTKSVVNRVPASAGIKAGMSPAPGNTV